jgi:hypothetical protein
MEIGFIRRPQFGEALIRGGAFAKQQASLGETLT